MKKKDKYWTPMPRADGRMEFRCPHGVGHGTGVHGCDGCCKRRDFPLKKKEEGAKIMELFRAAEQAPNLECKPAKPSSSDYCGYCGACMQDIVDTRTPKLEKVGCFFSQGNKECGIHFFEGKKRPDDGDVFIYNEGILWRVRK